MKIVLEKYLDLALLVAGILDNDLPPGLPPRIEGERPGQRSVHVQVDAGRKAAAYDCRQNAGQKKSVQKRPVFHRVLTTVKIRLVRIVAPGVRGVIPAILI